MRLSSVIIVALVLLAAVVFVSPVSAADTAPVLPHAFKGDVLVNGNPAPDGYKVSATVSEGEVVVDSQNPVTTTDGSYGKDGTLFLLVQGDITSGATINFYVNGVKASNTAVYTPGNVDVMDLSVSYTPTPTYSPGGGGGGGGSSSAYISTLAVKYTTTGYLQTDSNGIVQNPILVSAADGLSSVYIGAAVKALDADGQPLGSVTIRATDDVPSAGSFSFAGHAVELEPSGATFSPSVELTFQFTKEEWNNLAAGETFAIKWFNDKTGEWENIPTTVDPVNHTVVGEISHFSTFAVFKEIVGTPTSVATQAPSETPVPIETTGADGAQTGGFPWVWVIVVIAVVAIIGAGYYYMQQKN